MITPCPHNDAECLTVPHAQSPRVTDNFGKIAFTVSFEGRRVAVPEGYGPFKGVFDAHAARVFCEIHAKAAMGAYGHNIGTDGCAGMVYSAIVKERLRRAQQAAGEQGEPIDVIESRYQMHSQVPGDINQHLPTLYQHALDCESVVELGMRNGQSTWAFLRALRQVKHRTQKPVRLISMDITLSPHHIEGIRIAAREAGVRFAFVLADATQIPLAAADLLFIDTWHVYAQLKRELAVHAPNIRKYIVLHDTTLDGEHGTTVRKKWNATQQALETGFPIEEITRGIWPAVEEFLGEHPEWRLKQRWTNNNGLTVLARIS